MQICLCSFISIFIWLNCGFHPTELQFLYYFCSHVRGRFQFFEPYLNDMMTALCVATIITYCDVYSKNVCNTARQINYLDGDLKYLKTQWFSIIT